MTINEKLHQNAARPQRKHFLSLSQRQLK